MTFNVLAPVIRQVGSNVNSIMKYVCENLSSQKVCTTIYIYTANPLLKSRAVKVRFIEILYQHDVRIMGSSLKVSKHTFSDRNGVNENI